MSDWNDVITALEHDPAIHTRRPQPGTTRTLQATISTDDHGEITMVIDNDSREDWLQLIISVSDTSDANIWEAAGWCLKDIPALGLARLGDRIVIRHGILLPHADTHAITHGINLTVTAATTLYDHTTDTQSSPIAPVPRQRDKRRGETLQRMNTPCSRQGTSTPIEEPAPTNKGEPP